MNRLSRWIGVLALLALLALPVVAGAAEPTPTPPVVNEDALAGPLFGLVLVVASSAVAIGAAIGLSKRMAALSRGSRDEQE